MISSFFKGNERSVTVKKNYSRFFGSKRIQYFNILNACANDFRVCKFRTIWHLVNAFFDYGLA